LSRVLKPAQVTGRTNENWQRYVQNSRKYCFAHISVIFLGHFGYSWAQKPIRLQVRVPGVMVRVGKKTPGLPTTITKNSTTSEVPKFHYAKSLRIPLQFIKILWHVWDSLTFQIPIENHWQFCCSLWEFQRMSEILSYSKILLYKIIEHSLTQGANSHILFQILKEHL